MSRMSRSKTSPDWAALDCGCSPTTVNTDPALLICAWKRIPNPPICMAWQVCAACTTGVRCVTGVRDTPPVALNPISPRPRRSMSTGTHAHAHSDTHSQNHTESHKTQKTHETPHWTQAQTHTEMQTQTHALARAADGPRSRRLPSRAMVTNAAIACVPAQVSVLATVDNLLRGCVRAAQRRRPQSGRRGMGWSPLGDSARNGRRCEAVGA